MARAAAPMGRKPTGASPDGWPACLLLTHLPGPMLAGRMVSGLMLASPMRSGRMAVGALLFGTLLFGTLLFGTLLTGPIAGPAATGPAKARGGGARAISGGVSLTGWRARRTTTRPAACVIPASLLTPTTIPVPDVQAEPAA